MLTHASLFSGIGGFDLAAEWAGWENIFHCEWNEFGQKVLAHHFPNSKSYHDITKTDFSIHKGTIDVLTGGFPCQPYSSAGKRLGKADERHLFPHMLRAVKEIKPRWVIGENVRGLVSWNDGLVFNEVYNDLESEGYEVQSFLIPAASVNAPHQRYRIWFVAYSNDTRANKHMRNNGEWEKDDKGQKGEPFFKFGQSCWDVTDTSGLRLEQCGKSRKISNEERENAKRKKYQSSFSTKTMGKNVADSDTSRIYKQHFTTKSNKKAKFSRPSFERGDFSSFPTQPPICGGNDGLPNRLDGITFSKWRNESIKAYGNAIVPQVAYQIFKAINEFELLVNK